MEIPFDKQIWTPEKCAEYLQCSTEHFQNRITKMPTFPKGIAISDGKRPRMRWKATDIYKWIESRQLVQ